MNEISGFMSAFDIGLTACGVLRHSNRNTSRTVIAKASFELVCQVVVPVPPTAAEDYPSVSSNKGARSDSGDDADGARQGVPHHPSWRRSTACNSRLRSQCRRSW
jgi:hypothetical protein